MSHISRLFQKTAKYPLNIFKCSFSSSQQHFAIKNVTVIGSGLMGGGIAQVAAQAGNKVNVVDVNDDILKKSKNIIEQNVQRIAKKQFKDNPSKSEEFVKGVMNNLTFISDQNKAVSDADLVVEAIVENLEAKQKLFKALDDASPQKTIFASNTSSIPISEIASLTKRKDRFGGLHFFSPVPMMKLLEVVRINETSDQTNKDMNDWGKAIGKVTVQCIDTPGFIVNRLLIPYMNDSVRMVERGDATVPDIDTAVKLGLGYPMGPFELSDFVGIDVCCFIAEGWEKRFPNDPQFKTPELLKKMVKEGKIGRKAGKGWYNYEKK